MNKNKAPAIDNNSGKLSSAPDDDFENGRLKEILQRAVLKETVPESLRRAIGFRIRQEYRREE